MLADVSRGMQKKPFNTYTWVVTAGTVVSGVEAVESTGCVSMGDDGSGVVSTGVVSIGVVPTGEVSTGVVSTGVVSTGLLSTGMLTGAVGPAEVVALRVGMGYGLVSTGFEETGVDSTGLLGIGVELGTGGLDDGPQWKSTLWIPTSHFSLVSSFGSLTVTDLASPHWLFVSTEPPAEHG